MNEYTETKYLVVNNMKSESQNCQCIILRFSRFHQDLDFVHVGLDHSAIISVSLPASLGNLFGNMHLLGTQDVKMLWFIKVLIMDTGTDSDYLFIVTVHTSLPDAVAIIWFFMIFRNLSSMIRLASVLGIEWLLGFVNCRVILFQCQFGNNASEVFL